MLSSRSWILAMAGALLWTQSAAAHFLWLVTEQEGQTHKVKVYFSEAAAPDNPDLLDKVLKAEAWTITGRHGEATAIELKKGEDALVGTLPEDWPQSPVILKTTYGVMTRGDEPFLLKYYGKTYPSPLAGTWRTVKDEERLPLEIVPKADGATGLVLKVNWKGQPVEGATVTVTGPGLEKKFEATSDKDGLCRCELPVGGLYSIRAKHVEQAPGELDGKAYKSVRHYSTLALPFEPSRLAPQSSNLAPLPNGITSFGGAVAGDALYVYGGNLGSAHHYTDEDQSGDLLKLDLKNPTKWEQLGSGPKLQGLAMVAHKGSLYRVGGFTAMNKEGEEQNLRSQADFARYNLEKKAWEALPNLSAPRSSHDAALVGDTLYVVGGWNLQGGSRDSKWHETALAIDLASDKPEWKEIAAPPFQRRALTLAAANGKLYCIGGMQEKGGPTTATAIYDPASNSWSTGPALIGGSMEGFGASAFACQGKLYVTTVSGSIQGLAADGERWEYLGEIAHPRFFHRLLPWQDEKLLVVGGGSMMTGKVLEVEVLPVGGTRTAAK